MKFSRFFFEEHVAQDAILTNILAVMPSVKVHPICFFQSLVETAVTKKTLVSQMLEREGLVEEPGQDKGHRQKLKKVQ